MSHVFVIAEAGISHDGDLDKAKHLIDHAKAAGADAVKFQTFNAQKLAVRRKSPDLFAKLKPYEMPLSWLPQLKGHCDKVGIEFMTTCFDEETLKIVAPLLKRFKIGHAESIDAKFIHAHDEYRKEAIISTVNMHALADRLYYSPTRVLHCVSEYPCRIERLNLKALEYRGFYDGLSDHTTSTLTGALAVAAGADIVEKHIKLSSTDTKNPDWNTSLFADTKCLGRDMVECPFLAYVAHVRQAELAVYGQAAEETRKLERPGSAPHTSHQPASEVDDPSAYLQG